jgi:2-polyprenyl-3-methyl-5-hydroxy-6-metoxy-1,4-benzoquinol methylase
VNTLRDAWLTRIDPDDYEQHMAAAGQAQANASLLGDFLRDSPPPAGSPILFAGAGTGQLFDYMRPEALASYDVTFADINPVYLVRLAARTQTTRRRIAIDDIENPILRGPFDLIVAILVLEHVDWRRVVAAMCRRCEATIFTVIQQTPTSQHPTGEPVGTMSILRDLRPQSIDPESLAAEFATHGFALHHTSARPVPGNKTMLAMKFQNRDL